MMKMAHWGETLAWIRIRRRGRVVFCLISVVCLWISFKVVSVAIVLLGNNSKPIADIFSSFVAHSMNNESKIYGKALSESRTRQADKHWPVSLVSARSSSECDNVCLSFRKMILRWKSSKPKGAIYYLTRSDRIHSLTVSLTPVSRHFLENFTYPVIIFHENNLNRALRSSLQKRATKYQLFFQEVTFEFPPHINASSVVVNIDCFSHISYRHMCQFQAKGIYEQPILNGLDYLWRMDDDSQLLSNVQFDVFEFMSNHSLEYGYLKIWVDSLLCTKNLWKAAESFIKAQGFKPTFFKDWPQPTMYYNNIEISALSIWRSSSYRDYINYIDNLGGIFYHRWGDAPIKSIAVSLFVSYDKTHLFDTIAYKHGNFIKNGSYSSF